MADESNELYGIGGWLWLAVFGIMCVIAGAIVGFFQIAYSFYFLLASLDANIFTLDLADYLLLATYFAIFTWTLVTIFSGGMSLYHVFRRSRQAPWWAMFHYALIMAALLLNLGITTYAMLFNENLLRGIENLPAELAGGTFTAALALLGILYFRLSRRVRNTFTMP